MNLLVLMWTRLEINGFNKSSQKKKRFFFEPDASLLRLCFDLWLCETTNVPKLQWCTLKKEASLHTSQLNHKLRSEKKNEFSSEGIGLNLRHKTCSPIRIKISHWASFFSAFHAARLIVETKVGPIPRHWDDWLHAYRRPLLVRRHSPASSLPDKGLNMSELDLCETFEPHTIRFSVSYTNF
jgi:hypothetical protein